LGTLKIEWIPRTIESTAPDDSSSCGIGGPDIAVFFLLHSDAKDAVLYCRGFTIKSFIKDFGLPRLLPALAPSLFHPLYRVLRWYGVRIEP
jgi:hypothetical protein